MRRLLVALWMLLSCGLAEGAHAKAPIAGQASAPAAPMETWRQLATTALKARRKRHFDGMTGRRQTRVRVPCSRSLDVIGSEARATAAATRQLVAPAGK